MEALALAALAAALAAVWPTLIAPLVALAAAWLLGGRRGEWERHPDVERHRQEIDAEHPPE